MSRRILITTALALLSPCYAQIDTPEQAVEISISLDRFAGRFNECTMKNKSLTQTDACYVCSGTRCYIARDIDTQDALGKLFMFEAQTRDLSKYLRRSNTLTKGHVEFLAGIETCIADLREFLSGKTTPHSPLGELSTIIESDESSGDESTSSNESLELQTNIVSDTAIDDLEQFAIRAIQLQKASAEKGHDIELLTYTITNYVFDLHSERFPITLATLKPCRQKLDIADQLTEHLSHTPNVHLAHLCKIQDALNWLRACLNYTIQHLAKKHTSLLKTPTETATTHQIQLNRPCQLAGVV